MDPLWPKETPTYWTEVEEISIAQPLDLAFKVDYVAQHVPLYASRITSFDLIYLQEVLEYLDTLDASDYANVTRALRERYIGHTEESYADAIFSPHRDLKDISVWNVKSMHHWIVAEKLSQHSIHNYSNVIEIGAGIGESARILRDAYKWSGNYTILDLPGISRYANANLRGYDIDIATKLSDVPQHNGRTLVVSTWGLSEIEMEYRREVVDCFSDHDLFVSFQSLIFGVDNRQYFVREYPALYGKSIRLKNIERHDVDGGNFYMFATK